MAQLLLYAVSKDSSHYAMTHMNHLVNFLYTLYSPLLYIHFSHVCPFFLRFRKTFTAQQARLYESIWELYYTVPFRRFSGTSHRDALEHFDDLMKHILICAFPPLYLTRDEQRYQRYRTWGYSGGRAKWIHAPYSDRTDRTSSSF